MLEKCAAHGLAVEVSISEPLRAALALPGLNIVQVPDWPARAVLGKLAAVCVDARHRGPQHACHAPRAGAQTAPLHPNLFGVQPAVMAAGGYISTVCAVAVVLQRWGLRLKL